MTFLFLPLHLTTDQKPVLLAADHIYHILHILHLSPLPPRQEFLAFASLVCPNETELAILTQLPVGTIPEVQAAAHRLREMGAASVLVTLGAQGALLMTAENAAQGGQLIPSKRVERVVDTSGAGDCYIGSLAAFLSRGVRQREERAFL